MSLRFFRRMKLLPGVTLNMSRSGPSLSFGPRGAKYTVGPRGTRSTVGLPGTGLSYSKQRGWGSRKKQGAERREPEQSEERLVVREEAAGGEQERQLLRAVIAFQGNKLNEALLILDGNPLPDAQWMRGMIHVNQGNWKAAETELAAALKPGLGSVFESNGISVVLKYPITPQLTAEVEPNRKSTLLVIAEAQQEQDRHPAALQTLQSYLDDAAGDAIAAISYAEIALENGNPNVLAPAARHLAAVDLAANASVKWIVRLMEAEIKSAEGNPNGAISCYEDALREELEEDEELSLRYGLALALGVAGDRAACRRELSGIYARDPAFMDVAERLQAKR